MSMVIKKMNSALFPDYKTIFGDYLHDGSLSGNDELWQRIGDPILLDKVCRLSNQKANKDIYLY
jgi:hypothetical protein